MAGSSPLSTPSQPPASRRAATYVVVAAGLTVGLSSALLPAGLPTGLALVVGGILAGVGLAWLWRSAPSQHAGPQTASELARRLAEGRYTAMLERSPDAVLVLDPTYRITDANPRALALYGYSRDELIGRDSAELRPPELRDGLAAVRRAASGGTAPSYETRHVARDGTSFPVEVAMNGFDVEGETHYLVVLRDIRRRKAERQALLYQAELLAALNEGVVACDAQLRLTAFNPAAERIYGWTAGEVLGKPVSFVLRPTTNAVELLDIASLERQGGSVQLETTVQRKDRAPVDVEIAVVRLPPGEQGPSGYVSVHRDVSERKRMLAKLMLSDRMASLGTLAAGVAHEINNPLAYLMGNLSYALDVLRERGEPNVELLAALEEARLGSERVRQIVKDLGAFSRARDDSQRLVSVQALLENAIAITRSELRQAAVLETDFAEVPPVLASEARLGQAFVSLLVNAAQAIPPGQAERHHITVRTRVANGERVAIEVSDTGVGIEPAILPRIFDPFFTTRTVGKGTGLGLAVSHGIVTGLGGTIEVESRPGRGSTFRVLLPSAGARAAQRAERSTAPRGHARRILVVDDEPMVGRSVQRLLGGEHDVTVLERGQQALALLERGEQFDLVLCDLMMPDLSGIDVYEALEKSRPEVLDRFVFMTAGVYTERARLFLERVPNLKLEKPFELDKLHRVVGDALAAEGGATAEPGR
jgi:PAS domain S-box-containing protein